MNYQSLYCPRIDPTSIFSIIYLEIGISTHRAYLSKANCSERTRIVDRYFCIIHSASSEPSVMLARNGRRAVNCRTRRPIKIGSWSCLIKSVVFQKPKLKQSRCCRSPGYIIKRSGMTRTFWRISSLSCCTNEKWTT